MLGTFVHSFESNKTKRSALIKIRVVNQCSHEKLPYENENSKIDVISHIY